MSWLDNIRGLVRPRTHEAYTYRLERHVLPRFGHRRLDEISVDDILALISELRENGYSGWSIRSILTPLSGLFSHAVRRDLIAAQSRVQIIENPGTATASRQRADMLSALRTPTHPSEIAAD